MALFLLIKFKNEGKQGRAQAHGHLHTHTHNCEPTLIHSSWSLWERLIQWLRGRAEGYSAWGPWRGHASPSHKNTPLSLRQHQNRSQWVHLEVKHWKIYMQSSKCHHPDGSVGRHSAGPQVGTRSLTTKRLRGLWEGDLERRRAATFAVLSFMFMLLVHNNK